MCKPAETSSVQPNSGSTPKRGEQSIQCHLLISQHITLPFQIQTQCSTNFYITTLKKIAFRVILDTPKNEKWVKLWGILRSLIKYFTVTVPQNGNFLTPLDRAGPGRKVFFFELSVKTNASYRKSPLIEHSLCAQSGMQCEEAGSRLRLTSRDTQFDVARLLLARSA